MQHHGATVWARQTVCSDIFVNKPDKWFKIWFYLVTRANYKTVRGWNRGEFFIQSGEIESATGATKDQVKKCLKWLRDEHSISTQRSTRGMHIKVLNYNVYQDLSKYSSTREAPEKHQRSTTIGEISNKEINISEQSSAELKINKENDMGWNKYSDDYEAGVVDYDSGELHNPEEEAKAAERELNNKIRHNLSLVEDIRGLSFGKGKDMNYHVKIYRSMLDGGWTHQRIIEEFIELINSDFWKEKKKMGQYPGMNTLQHHLRNQQPS